MPVPKKVLAAFERKYGKKKGKGVFFGYEKNHPEAARKMMKTAKKHKDKMV